MVDYLKKTIIEKLSKEVNIEIKESLVESESKPTKLLFKKKINDNTIEVIDFESYDMYGIEVYPILVGIENLCIYIEDVDFTSKIVNYSNGILELEKYVTDIYMEELLTSMDVLSKECDNTNNEDYIYISSLYSLNKRLNATTTEYYRRFEIGVFIYNDPNQNKCNYYMKKISKSLDKDFNIIDEHKNNIDYAYIFNPIKFDVEENGKLNRVVYGSIMIKTIEINFK